MNEHKDQSLGVIWIVCAFSSRSQDLSRPIFLALLMVLDMGLHLEKWSIDLTRKLMLVPCPSLLFITLVTNPIKNPKSLGKRGIILACISHYTASLRRSRYEIKQTNARTKGSEFNDEFCLMAYSLQFDQLHVMYMSCTWPFHGWHCSLRARHF